MYHRLERGFMPHAHRDGKSPGDPFRAPGGLHPRHMKKASVRDLPYRFSAVEDLLRDGEEIHITKRKRVIARLLPPDPVAPAAFPARQKKTFGKKRLKVSGAEQLAAERERF